LFILWTIPDFVIVGACWTGPDGACLTGGNVLVPKGANDRGVKTTDLIREFAWGTGNADGTTSTFHTVESVPVPADANGDDVVLAAANSVGVPEFPLSGYSVVAVGLSAIILAYSKRRFQSNVA